MVVRVPATEFAGRHDPARKAVPMPASTGSHGLPTREDQGLFAIEAGRAARVEEIAPWGSRITCGQARGRLQIRGRNATAKNLRDLVVLAADIARACEEARAPNHASTHPLGVHGLVSVPARSIAKPKAGNDPVPRLRGTHCDKDLGVFTVAVAKSVHRVREAAAPGHRPSSSGSEPARPLRKMDCPVANLEPSRRRGIERLETLEYRLFAALVRGYGDSDGQELADAHCCAIHRSIVTRVSERARGDSVGAADEHTRQEAE